MEIPITEYLNIRYLIKNKEGKIIYPTNKNEINYIKRILKFKHIDEEKCKELVGFSNKRELEFAKYLINEVKKSNWCFDISYIYQKYKYDFNL